MIGQKITINGVEWEEISEKEFDKLPNEEGMLINIHTLDSCLFYKKVEQQVFPKVFEGEGTKVFVYENKDISFSSEDEKDIYFTIMFQKTFEALKQALAFRDKLLEKKGKYDKL